MTVSVVVIVRFKPSVLEPQGKAVLHSLEDSGATDISSVRIGKYIELQVESSSENEALKLAEEIAEQVLANPVTETYSVQLVNNSKQPK